MHARTLLSFALVSSSLVACSGSVDGPSIDEGSEAGFGEETTAREETSPPPPIEDTAVALDTFVAADEGVPDLGSVIDTAPPPPPPPDTSVKKVLTYVWKGQENGYYCGPGSTRIALTTRVSDPPSQSTLGKLMGTDAEGTDHIGLVANALNKYLATTKYKTKVIHDPPTAAQRAGLKSDVLALIGSGWPIVANVISGWRPPGYPGGTIYHYVAIVGYDEGGEKVLIADPAGEGAAGSSWTKVPRTYWISIANAGTWIGGKGYTGL